MSNQDVGANKVLYYRFATLLGQCDLGELDEILAPEFIDHSLPAGVAPGVGGLKRLRAMMGLAFVGQQLTLEDVIGEGDRVVGRVRLRAPDGAATPSSHPRGEASSVEAIEIVRIVEGRIAERWQQPGEIERLRQLGFWKGG